MTLLLLRLPGTWSLVTDSEDEDDDDEVDSEDSECDDGALSNVANPHASSSSRF